MLGVMVFQNEGNWEMRSDHSKWRNPLMMFVFKIELDDITGTFNLPHRLFILLFKIGK